VGKLAFDLAPDPPHIIFMKLIVLAYLTLAIMFWIYKSSRKPDLKEWVPKDFYPDLKECSLEKRGYFPKGNEIPQNEPTILIIGKLKTTNRTIILLDICANIVTFGFLRLDEILPVGKPTKLRLYLKNISRIPTPIIGWEANFLITYPGKNEPDRQWIMKFPDLKYVGHGCFIESKSFFCPELPGSHELKIVGFEGIVLAGPFGVGDRRYRIPDTGAPWKLSFHVSSGYEYKIFLIALCALVVSMASMAVSLIGD